MSRLLAGVMALLFLCLPVLAESGQSLESQRAHPEISLWQEGSLATFYNTEMPEVDPRGNPPADYAGYSDDRVMVGHWENIPRVDTQYKVFDFAGALTSDQQDALEARTQELIAEYDTDIVVLVTANTLGRSIEDFSRDFFEANAFGTGKKTDGIIFTIDYHRRQIHVSTHGRMIRYYNDATHDKVHQRVGQVLGADITNTYGAVSAFLDTTQELFQHEGARVQRNLLIAGVSGGVVALGVLLILYYNHKNTLPGAVTAQHYIPQDQIVMNNQSDQFVHTYTTRTARSDSSSGGGGGGGGGSSTSSSSSGSSFGGSTSSF